MPPPKSTSPTTSSGWVCALAIVRQIALHEVEAEQAYRDVHEEHDAPVEVGHDQAARDRADHRADQARDGDEAHGAHEVGLAEGAREGHAADRHHHRAARTWITRQAMSISMLVAEAAQDRAHGEQADGRGEDAAGTETIGHPAADRNEDGEAQRVARQHRLHIEWRDLHRPGDRWHGGVQDRRVERLHEECDGYQPGQQPLDGIAGQIGRGVGHHQSGTTVGPSPTGVAVNRITLALWRSHVGFVPVLVGIEQRDRRRPFTGFRAEIAFIHHTVLVDDEGHDTGLAVAHGPGDDTEAADHAVVDEIVVRSALGCSP